MLTRRNRQTGTVIVLASAEEVGADDEDGRTKWFTLCVDHDQLTGHESQAVARAWMSQPLVWCERCNGSEPLEGEEDVDLS